MAVSRFFLSISHLCNLPPFEKGDKGGFEFGFSCCHRVDSLKEPLRHHSGVYPSSNPNSAFAFW